MWASGRKLAQKGRRSLSDHSVISSEPPQSSQLVSMRCSLTPAAPVMSDFRICVRSGFGPAPQSGRNAVDDFRECKDANHPEEHGLHIGPIVTSSSRSAARGSESGYWTRRSKSPARRLVQCGCAPSCDAVGPRFRKASLQETPAGATASGASPISGRRPQPGIAGRGLSRGRKRSPRWPRIGASL